MTTWPLKILAVGSCFSLTALHIPVQGLDQNEVIHEYPLGRAVFQVLQGRVSQSHGPLKIPRILPGGLQVKKSHKYRALARNCLGHRKETRSDSTMVRTKIEKHCLVQHRKTTGCLHSKLSGCCWSYRLHREKLHFNQKHDLARVIAQQVGCLPCMLSIWVQIKTAYVVLPSLPGVIS